jgi:hypothetical protein
LLINDKERTKAKKAEVAGSTRKIKKQKELVLLVRVVKIHCLKVVEQFLDQDQEVIHLN